MTTILALAANPMNEVRLRLEHEINEIEDHLMQAGATGYKLERTGAVQVENLVRLLLKYNPTIVHFSGHGSEKSEMLLEDNSGNSNPVNPDLLKQVFEKLKGSIRCVVLNSCYSANQAEAIANSIDCVIGMSSTIEDKAAIAFSSKFYLVLGSGCSIKKAFDLGCLEIGLQNCEGENTPVLISKKIDPDKVYITGKPEIQCEFEMTQKGAAKRTAGGYLVNVFIKNTPENTISVVYQLDDESFRDTDTEYTEVPNSSKLNFPLQLEATNDFEIRATIWFAKEGLGVKMHLIQALQRNYGPNANASIKRVIQKIDEG